MLCGTESNFSMLLTDGNAAESLFDSICKILIFTTSKLTSKLTSDNFQGDVMQPAMSIVSVARSRSRREGL